jgi:histidinol phosphatase-like PHP family hydrolase
MQLDPVFAVPGRLLKGNIHTHSNRSDGQRVSEDVVDTYRRGGYHFTALTDHFMTRYGFPIVDTRRIRTLLRAEVFAPATLLGEIWYIRAVGLIGRCR